MTEIDSYFNITLPMTIWMVNDHSFLGGGGGGEEEDYF